MLPDENDKTLGQAPPVPDTGIAKKILDQAAAKNVRDARKYLLVRLEDSQFGSTQSNKFVGEIYRQLRPLLDERGERMFQTAMATNRRDAIKYDMVVAYVHPSTIETVAELLGGVEILDMVGRMRNDPFGQPVETVVEKLTRDVMAQLIYGREFWLMVSCPEEYFKTHFGRADRLGRIHGVKFHYGYCP